MSELPVYQIIPELRQQLERVTTVILQAPPGAGKSTVLPLELLNEKWLFGRKIIMLEPRRLAARAVASRLAQLLNEEVGQTVGYRVRFDNRVSSATRIEVVTEGILTRMLQADNALEGVGLVIFDEFHERSLHADLALALCVESQQVLREDLRLLIMSATLDGQKLSALLHGAPVINSEGRQYPITYRYFPAEPNQQLTNQVAATIKLALREEEGDILAFLPGAGEITKVIKLLEEEPVKLCALYGDLSPSQQQEAILPDKFGQRKVVVATSIAETSLTIEGVRVVVDSGLARVNKFDPKSGLSRLETVKVTKDAADQRAGRAGRMAPGVCYRLWAERSHQYLVDHRVPEILEADLAPAMLELYNWGVNDMSGLAWLTPPPVASVAQANELLSSLAAIELGRITEQGKRILKLPTHPRLAHMLLEGQQLSATSLATDLVAIIEEKDALARDAGADITLRLEAIRRWRSNEKVNAERASLERQERLALSWRRIMHCELDNSTFDHMLVGRLLAAAFPERIARKRDGSSDRYQLANGRAVKLDMQDPLAREKWLVVAQLDAGTQEGKIFSAAPVDPSDLAGYTREQSALHWDEVKGVIVAQQEVRIGDLLVASRATGNIDGTQRIALLLQAFHNEGWSMFTLDEACEQWLARVNSLRLWRPTEAWPSVDLASLKQRAEEWLAPYLNEIKKRDEMKKLNLLEMLQASLPWELSQQLSVLAPTYIKVPSGSEIRLQYSDDGSFPVLAVRLQEMFGLLDTPLVNEGRTKVMLHLLSPGYKPVQVTQDLKSFWQNTYPEVRKELRIRYAKHHWPEDPWTAEAVRGAKRRQ